MRTRSVIRLHTANKFTAFGLPFLIMGLAFAIILAIGIVARLNLSPSGLNAMYEGMVWNGAVFSYLGPLMGLGFMAMGQYFALATGLGITRKEFAAGTSIVFIGFALMFAAVTAVGKMIEKATGGWGLSIRFFDVNYTGVGPGWLTFVQTFLLITTLMFVGAAIMTAFLRRGQLFLWLFFLTVGVAVLAVVGTALLVPAFAGWLRKVALMGWLPWMGVLVAVALAGAAVWLVLVRRAQVR